jgi:SOS-response transcriptional repressor LexA
MRTPDPSLFEIVGHEALLDPAGVVWRDDRLRDLLADANDEARHRESDTIALVRGHDLQMVALARRYGVRRLESEPVSAAAPVATARQLMDLARRMRTSPVVDLGVAAGVGRELWDEPVERWIPIPDDLPSGDYVSLKVDGDSMSPLLHTGDTVLVRLGQSLETNRIVVGRHPEDGYVCKLVRRFDRRQVVLASLQPGRPEVTIPDSPSLIFGTVLMVWCPHRSSPAPFVT